MARRGGVLALVAAAGVVAVSRSVRQPAGDEIARLHAVDDARAIVWLLGTRVFGWDVETALSLALFRTYASPEISVVLAATGEFTERARKRFDDTELVLAELAKHGVGDPRGRAAMRRMNQMHAAFDLERDDLLYVLSTFVLEPMRFIGRWGWRPMTAHERAASLAYYVELGRHMGLGELPLDLGWWEEHNRVYEAERFRFHPANRAVADASLRMFLDAQLPPSLHGPGRVVVRALLDDRLLTALGLTPAPRVVVRAVDAALRVRAHVQRVLPERRRPRDLTQVGRPTYPHGHRVEGLGTWPDGAIRTRVARAQASLRTARPQ